MEFNARLEAKVEQLSRNLLIHYLLDFACEEISEVFNNEIIEEWEREHDHSATLED